MKYLFPSISMPDSGLKASLWNWNLLRLLDFKSGTAAMRPTYRTQALNGTSEGTIWFPPAPSCRSSPGASPLTSRLEGNKKGSQVSQKSTWMAVVASVCWRTRWRIVTSAEEFFQQRKLKKVWIQTPRSECFIDWASREEMTTKFL